MKKLVFIIAFINLLFFPGLLRAQDSLEVVVFSQRVGPFIDPGERDYFRVFLDDKNFVLAYCTRDSVDAYSVHIVYLDNKEIKERQIAVQKISLLNFGEKFDNYEKIKQGDYTRGSNPPELKFLWIKKDEISKNIKSTRNNSFVDYPIITGTGVDYKKLLIHYPRFGIGISAAGTNFKFEGLEYLTGKIDNYYKAKGYDVKPINPDYNLGAIFRLKAIIEMTPDISASLMVDNNLTGKIKYSALTLIGLYDFIHLPGNFVPFAGLGYSKNRFNINIDYGRASVDSLGGMLESVSVDGGTEGLFTEAGIKAVLGNSVYIGIAADYYFLTTYKSEETAFADFSVEIKPGNFSAGIFLNIIF